MYPYDRKGKQVRRVMWGDLVDALYLMEGNLAGHSLFQCNTVDIFERGGHVLVAYSRLRTLDFQIVGV